MHDNAGPTSRLLYLYKYYTISLLGSLSGLSNHPKIVSATFAGLPYTECPHQNSFTLTSPPGAHHLVAKLLLAKPAGLGQGMPFCPKNLRVSSQ